MRGGHPGGNAIKATTLLACTLLILSCSQNPSRTRAQTPPKGWATLKDNAAGYAIFHPRTWVAICCAPQDGVASYATLSPQDHKDPDTGIADVALGIDWVRLNGNYETYLADSKSEIESHERDGTKFLERKAEIADIEGVLIESRDNATRSHQLDPCNCVSRDYFLQWSETYALHLRASAETPELWARFRPEIDSIVKTLHRS